MATRHTCEAGDEADAERRGTADTSSPEEDGIITWSAQRASNRVGGIRFVDALAHDYQRAPIVAPREMKQP
jgi:hypothetical protein